MRFSWVGKHHFITTHDGRRRQRTVPYQTPSPRPKFRVVQGLKFTVERTGKFKRMRTFFLWTKKSFALPKLCFEEFNPVFFPAGLDYFENMQPEQQSFWRSFSCFLYFVVVKITFLKANLCICKWFLDVNSFWHRC